MPSVPVVKCPDSSGQSLSEVGTGSATRATELKIQACVRTGMGLLYFSFTRFFPSVITLRSIRFIRVW
jgi:hypothetical protein